MTLARWYGIVRNVAVSSGTVVGAVWLYRTRDGRLERGLEHLELVLKDRIDSPAQQSGSAALKCGHHAEREAVQKHVRGESTTALIVYGQRESGKSWTVTDELMNPTDMSEPPITAYVKLNNVTTVPQLAAAVETAFRYRGDSDVANLIRDFLQLPMASGSEERKENNRLARALNFAESVSKHIYNTTGRPVVIVIDDLDAIRTLWSHTRTSLTGSVGGLGSGLLDMADGEAMQLQSELFKLTTRIGGWARTTYISPIVLCSDQRKTNILFGQKNSNFNLLRWGEMSDQDIEESLARHLQKWVDPSASSDAAVHPALEEISRGLAGHVVRYFGRRPGPIRTLFVDLQDERSPEIQSIRDEARNTVVPPSTVSAFFQSLGGRVASGDTVAEASPGDGERHPAKWQTELREHLEDAIVTNYNQATKNALDTVHACIHRTADELRRHEPNMTPKAMVDRIHSAVESLLADLTSPRALAGSPEQVLGPHLGSRVAAISPTLRGEGMKPLSVELYPVSGDVVLRSLLLDACVLEGVDTSHVSSPSPACSTALRLSCADLAGQATSKSTLSAPAPHRTIDAETEAQIVAEAAWRDADREARTEQAQLDREARAEQAQLDRAQAQLDREARTQQAQLDREARTQQAQLDRSERQGDRWMYFVLGLVAAAAYVYKK